ncbi:sugar phosphate isomerase/epimerase [Microcella alkalica]|uniref:Sugar phosphate isomerase/epimerase n=1 Tax=Microcella alkalica TaxID=355930 RepID=A0A839E3V7_9MICO|nr:sugar phosphate isomerase/epimerase [Microcella alkalica]MBA8846480.1 sugar phosphate isomerase/epimerase [Microcella alkalica]
MIRVGMGTTSVLPRRLEPAFLLARDAGFDGVEVMITSDRATQSARTIGALSTRYGMPVLSIHAPVLLFSTLVFGRNPRTKLERAAALAEELGATTVVAHPPWRWQGRWAAVFEAAVAEIATASGVTIAVENMFPVAAGGRARDAFAPHWNPGELAVDRLVLDVSHASMARVSALELARAWGDRLHHVHLCDAAAPDAGGRLVDAHLVPGRGGQPVAALLRHLVASGFAGDVVAELNTRHCGRDDRARLAELRETVAFAREHLA